MRNSYFSNVVSLSNTRHWHIYLFWY